MLLGKTKEGIKYTNVYRDIKSGREFDTAFEMMEYAKQKYGYNEENINFDLSEYFTTVTKKV